MKRVGLVALVLLLPFGTPDAAAAEHCPATEIVVGAHNTPPHSVQTNDGPKGPDVDVVVAVMKRVGCPVTFVQQPWARILETMARDGAIHMSTLANKLAQRQRFAWYSRSYIDLERLLFVRTADMTPYRSLEDFFERGRFLGRVRGYSFGEAYDRAVARFPDLVDDVNHQEHNARKLVMGRIDGVIGERLQILDAFTRAGLSGATKSTGIEIAPKTGSYLIFSKKSVPRAFVDRVDRTLDDMVADGTLAAILEPYGARAPTE